MVGRDPLGDREQRSGRRRRARPAPIGDRGAQHDPVARGTGVSRRALRSIDDAQRRRGDRAVTSARIHPRVPLGRIGSSTSSQRSPSHHRRARDEQLGGAAVEGAIGGLHHEPLRRRARAARRAPPSSPGGARPRRGVRWARPGPPPRARRRPRPRRRRPRRRRRARRRSPRAWCRARIGPEAIGGGGAFPRSGASRPPRPRTAGDSARRSRISRDRVARGRAGRRRAPPGA